MKKNIRTQPIGIFDSGIGGLTVTQALVSQLPRENILYYGDTAHLPYGDKSSAAIQSYSIKIADILLAEHCKLILIACNSASSAAYELIKDYVGNRAIVIDVINPLIQHLGDNYAGKRLGLIGTRQTVNSRIYHQKITQLNCGIELVALATNLLASAIEEFGNHAAIEGIIREYLSHSTLKDRDALILACTHYAVVKEKISRFFDHRVEIIDPSETVAVAVKNCLMSAELLNVEGHGQKRFYVSDYTPSFEASTKLFFAEKIHLEYYPLRD